MAEDFGPNRSEGVSRTVPAERGESPPVGVLRLDRIDSTNREAERRIASGDLPGPLLVVAREQTAGEGRRGATWWSPPGGLWATMAWELGPSGDAIIDGLGLRLGLACLRTVRRVAPAARLKWPNDVLVDARKVCGCMGRLISAPDHRRWILAAAGINANNPIDPIDPPLADRAASLREITGAEVNIGQLEGSLCEQFRWALTTQGIEPSMVEEANAGLAGVGAPIRLRDAGETVDGELLGLGPRGTPRVRIAGGHIIEVGPSAETIHDA